MPRLVASGQHLQGLRKTDGAAIEVDQALGYSCMVGRKGSDLSEGGGGLKVKVEDYVPLAWRAC